MKINSAFHNNTYITNTPSTKKVEGRNEGKDFLEQLSQVDKEYKMVQSQVLDDKQANQVDKEYKIRQPQQLSKKIQMVLKRAKEVREKYIHPDLRPELAEGSYTDPEIKAFLDSKESLDLRREAGIECTRNPDVKLSNQIGNYREWLLQMREATNENKYEDAPEFEAFVKKWMDKGESERDAIYRAEEYANAGLLNYGKQKVIALSNYDLPYGDIKQHGMHLIDNPPLKKALLKTLDNLNLGHVRNIVRYLFSPYQIREDYSGESPNFQEMLDKFAAAIQKSKEEKNFTFTGDINLKHDFKYKDYNNFIFDTLIEFFEKGIQSLDLHRKKTEEECQKEAKRMDKLLNKLVYALKKEIEEYNSTNS